MLVDVILQRASSLQAHKLLTHNIGKVDLLRSSEPVRRRNNQDKMVACDRLDCEARGVDCIGHHTRLGQTCADQLHDLGARTLSQINVQTRTLRKPRGELLRQDISQRSRICIQLQRTSRAGTEVPKLPLQQIVLFENQARMMRQCFPRLGGLDSPAASLEQDDPGIRFDLADTFACRCQCEVCLSGASRNAAGIDYAKKQAQIREIKSHIPLQDRGLRQIRRRHRKSRIVPASDRVCNARMNTPSIELICLLFATFLGAGMVKGVTGMGLPTVAMGVLGAIMSPLTAAAILIVPSFVTNVWQMLAGKYIGRLMRRLWTMMFCVVIGTVLATRLLVVVDPVWSGRALGIALIAYAGYALFSPTISIPERLEPWLSPIIGMVTGLLTGATGVFTIPAVPYVQSLGLQKDELVQALGLSFTVSTVALAGGLMVQDAFRFDQLGLSLLAVIPSLAGMWLGSIVRKKISPKAFRRCFLLFLIILGLELALRPFS